MDEDSGISIVPLSGISAGPAGEEWQKVILEAKSSDTNLIAKPLVTYDGFGTKATLKFTPVPDAFGTTTITVTATDNGGTESGATNHVSVTFKVTLRPVNDAPSLVMATNLIQLPQDSGPYVFTNWATQILAGPPNESVQILTVTNITLGRPDLFIVPPTLNLTNGNLTFQTASNLAGTSGFSFRLRDNGGTTNSGIDLSPEYQVTIDVTAVNKPPTISVVEPQLLNQDSVGSVSFAVGDAETAAEKLTVTASSADAGLLPVGAPDLSGSGTNRILRLAPVAGKTGSTTVTLTVSDGELSASTRFVVTVSALNTPPKIVSQPEGRSVLVGTTVQLSVGAVGTAPLVYQWLVNGTNVPSGTNATLSLGNVGTGASGSYTVVIRNQAGVVTSAPAFLFVGQLGSKLWDTSMGRAVRSSAAMGADGTLYVGTDEGQLVALTRFGQVVWRFSAGGAIVSSPALAPDGTVVFGSQDGLVYALRPDGSVRWTFRVGVSVDSSPAVDAAGGVYFGADDGNVYALDAEGGLRWRFGTGQLIYGSPAISADGVLYLGSFDGVLYALNTRDGSALWTRSIGTVIASSPAVDGLGRVLVGAGDKRLYCVGTNGTVVWSRLLSGAVSASPVVGTNGVAYVGTEDGRLAAVSTDGLKLWEFATGGAIFSTAALGSDGTIYVGSFDNRIYGVNPGGAKRWEFATGGAVYASPTLDRDGVLYVGSLDGRFYAIKGASGVGDFAWPMFRRDVAHTGRVPGSAVVLAPVLGGVRLVPGGVELQVSGEVGVAVVVEAADTLLPMQFRSVGTVTIPAGGRGVFVDPVGLGLGSRYYRLRR